MDSESAPKEKVASYLDRKPDLNEAKANFLAAATNISPFKIVRAKPLTSIGVAFLAGLGLASLGSSKTAQPVMNSMSQIAGIVAQLAPLFAARARSSGG